MRNKKIQTLKMKFIIVGFLLSGFSINAETVILRSHDVIHGKITYQDALVLRMNDDLGKPLELQKNDILKVSYRDVKDAKEIKKIIEEEESKLPPEKRKKAVAEAPKRKIDIIWRSALVPGLGQWKAGKKWYAAFSLLAVSGLAMRSQSLQANAFNANKDYKLKSAIIGLSGLNSLQTGNVTGTIGVIVLSNAVFSPYNDSVTNYNNSLQFVGLAYGIQLIHSYFVGRDWENQNANTTIGKKAAFGEWNINASPRQAYAPTATGVGRETFYEVNYEFRF